MKKKKKPIKDLASKLEKEMAKKYFEEHKWDYLKNRW
jgi:hypothetical protein